jgi:GNAT superfamily N-acetyltransferase
MALISFHRIEDSRDPYFERARELYESAFPVFERRSVEQLKQDLNHPFFHAEIVEKDQKFTGILFWWQLGSFRFIEHFAIIPQMRGKGIGKQVLTSMIQTQHTPIILEVEPERFSSDAIRRIAFYKKSGFHLNQYPYFQPPYHPGNKPIPLQIMSYPNPINPFEFPQIVREIHKQVYQV